MVAKRVILEMGAGNDLHGMDYTKAAIRAVQDALHHSSLVMIRTLGVDKSKMLVDVTIGAQQPDQVDTDAVKETLPRRSGDGQRGQRRTRPAGSGNRRHAGDRQRRDRRTVGY